MLVYTNEGLPCARFPEMPNPCYCTGDAGNHASFPAFSENMEPTNQAVRLLKGALAHCSKKRIQRIILDEIHTIGQDESGTVWEQIILLAPCPIMSVAYSVFNNVRSNVP
jgi:hypothetical protein